MNKNRPHLLVLPEDDANRQIVNGFALEPRINPRQLQILKVADGWSRARDLVVREHLFGLAKIPHRFLLLVIDFDGRPTRADEIKLEVPIEVRDRVFVLGSLSVPEKLRQALGVDFEEIGRSLAEECSVGGRVLWRHGLLVHNRQELDRLVYAVKPFLVQ